MCPKLIHLPLILLVQVNFMSAQMLAAASKEVEVSGESLDEMRLLEEQARKIAEEAKRDEPQKKAMTFVK